MKTDNFNIIKNNLFIFFTISIIIVLLVDRRHKFIILLILIKLWLFYESTEKNDEKNDEKINELFTEQSIQNNIENINSKKLNYGHKYDIIKIDEISNRLVFLCKYYEQLKSSIHMKLIDVYSQIKQNDELKNYLKLMNLIDDNGMPLFANQCEDVSLFNEIKILLVTLPKK